MAVIVALLENYSFAIFKGLDKLSVVMGLGSLGIFCQLEKKSEKKMLRKRDGHNHNIMVRD